MVNISFQYKEDKYGSIIVVLFISIILGIEGGTETGFISQFTNCQIVKAENMRNPSDIPDIIFRDNLYETVW